MNDFSVENIIAGNGLGISITGMSIVFTGLVVLSIIIYYLPKALAIFDKLFAGKEEQKITLSQVQDPMREGEELVTAIAAVIHMEMQRSFLEDTQKITIARVTNQKSLWATSSNMKYFSSR